MAEIDLVEESVKSYLNNNRIFYKTDYLIKYETCFKSGGVAKYFICPSSQEQFANLVVFFKSNSIVFKVIGATSNLLFLDEDEYGVIVSTVMMKNVLVTQDGINVEAGYMVSELARIALINGSTGFEGLEGIPATVGGALFMNAGAYGYAISDHLLSVTGILEDGSIVKFDKKEMNFSYRKSMFREKRIIVLSARFSFQPDAKENIQKKMEIFHIARHSYQDFTYPNLGSVISNNGQDVVYHLVKDDRISVFIYLFVKLLYRNPFVKFLMRKRPNNEIANRVVRYYFNKKGINDFNSMSNKSINILINDGDSKSDSFVRHINYIFSRMPEGMEVENELVSGFGYKGDSNL